MAAQIVAYERGSQAPILSGMTTAGGGNDVSGTTAPANAKVYSIVPVVSRGQIPPYAAFQVDLGGGTATSAKFNIYGSLDGTNFYVIGTLTISSGAVGAIFTPGAGETTTPIAFPAPVKYLTAGWVSGTVAGGTGVSISFAM